MNKHKIMAENVLPQWRDQLLSELDFVRPVQTGNIDLAHN